MKHIDPVYKSAEELGITEQERTELIESIPYFLNLAPAEFRMCDWGDCICGHIARRNGRDPREEYKNFSPALKDLYSLSGKVWATYRQENSVWYARPDNAAWAIVHFLSGV